MVRTLASIVLAGAALVAGCAGTPKTHSARLQLENQAAEAKEAMLYKDPALSPLLQQSAGYFVFPAVKEGGFIVGGAGADGVLYENGRPTGYAQLSRVSLGAQIGGQKYSELVAVRDRFMLEKLKTGSVEFGGGASVVVLKAGAAAATQFGDNGIAVLIDPIGGAMVSASVSGQRIETRARM
jgi:lipid-binding SYLF domain-containing protein